MAFAKRSEDNTFMGSNPIPSANYKSGRDPVLQGAGERTWNSSRRLQGRNLYIRAVVMFNG